jgi:hypothetical protein
VLSGTEHVLLLHVGASEGGLVSAITEFAQRLPEEGAPPIRVVVVTPSDPSPLPGLRILRDEVGAFAAKYGLEASAFLVRPDGHIGWRGQIAELASMKVYLRSVFGHS